MQVVIDKLQAGARKAQEVAHKLESPQATAQAAEDLVSALHMQRSYEDWNKHIARLYPVPARLKIHGTSVIRQACKVCLLTVSLCGGTRLHCKLQVHILPHKSQLILSVQGCICRGTKAVADCTVLLIVCPLSEGTRTRYVQYVANVQAEEVENAEAMAADGLTSAEKVPKSLPPVIEAQAGQLLVMSCTSCVLAMTSHRYDQRASTLAT